MKYYRESRKTGISYKEYKEGRLPGLVTSCIGTTTSSVALQPGVGLGLLYNMPPSLSIPCSISPFVYSHLLYWNCLLKHVIEGHTERRIEVAGK